MKIRLTGLFFIIVIFSTNGYAQQIINYEKAKEYRIADIQVEGIQYIAESSLIQVSGLNVDDTIKIPGPQITDAIDNLWRKRLFSDVKITASKIDGNDIYLVIHLREQPRLSRIDYEGIRSSEEEDIEELIEIKRGYQVNENAINDIKIKIKAHYKEKGFHKTDVTITQKNDSSLINTVILQVKIEKNDKIKVEEVIYEGNTVFTDAKINRIMKKTNAKNLRNFFRSSKFIEEEYEADHKKLIAKYNEQGYRDAKITFDTVYDVSEDRVNIKIKIDEGQQYFFRNITWVGNTKYTSEQLSKVLNIQKGDVYNQEFLNKRLNMDEDAVGNLYLDDGYLFYNCTPVEKLLENDSIDLEMRIVEGNQATIRNVTITGNTKTKEHVIRRELYTKPGYLFSKTAITRSIRELAQLGHFDPEKLNVNPVPDPQAGTVDIEFIVEEKANDQLELSGGWGAGMIIGTLGIRFNNFSAGDVFKKGAWRPIPSGDGQQLSVRAQSNGYRYQSYSVSFVEPWLGGKKPNSFSVSFYRSLLSNGYQKDNPNRTSMITTGAAIGLGHRLKVPDDYFQLFGELSFQTYQLDDWSGFIISNGTSNNVSGRIVFSRNSLDNPLYTRSGSSVSVDLQITPPYSLFKKDKFWEVSNTEAEANNMSADEIYTEENKRKYKWVEYHKWNFKADWYTRIIPNVDLVFHTKYQFGYLGHFNKDLKSPFEYYYLGGSGIYGYSWYGRENVSLRGYEEGALTPENGGYVYNKMSLELRYPVSLNPQATIYVLSFLEAGNAWSDFKDFNPYNMNRAAGFGVRIFLPFLGMMGLDWGYGFDATPYNPGQGGSQFHFILGQQF